METRALGKNGPLVSVQGLGCMAKLDLLANLSIAEGMTAFYNPDPDATEAESLSTLDKAVELGLTLIDTAHVYANPAKGKTNEGLIAKALAKNGRDKYFVCTKFGIMYDPAAQRLVFDSSPAMIRAQLAESLARLGTDYVDLYYQHRHDANTPITTVMQTLKELVTEGKVKHVGLSECTPAELRAAHAVHRVAAVQLEWSLQTRDVEAELVPTCRELGVAIVAYSPLGRGLLSRTFTTTTELAEGDWRKTVPRFQPEAMKDNEAAAARLEVLATKKGITAAQLALAWVHNQGDDVFPIPGCKKVAHLVANARAASIKLTAVEMQEVETAVPQATGERYEGMHGTFNSRSGGGLAALGGV